MRQMRTLRIVQVVFVAYILLLFWMLRLLPAGPGPHSMTPVAWSIVCIALLSAVLGFVLQSWVLRAPASPQAVSKSSPIRRWFAGHVIRMAFSLAVSLYGLILHSTGAPNSAAASLMGLGLILILFWSPGDVPDGKQLGGPRN